MFCLRVVQGAQLHYHGVGIVYECRLGELKLQGGGVDSRFLQNA